MEEKQDSCPRRKAPPPRWTDPAPVKAAPPTARNREVAELKEEHERRKNEREALRQQVEQDRQVFFFYLAKRKSSTDRERIKEEMSREILKHGVGEKHQE